MMTQAQSMKLKQVLENNRKWPLIIVGAPEAYFQEDICLSADLSASELYQMGGQIPVWIQVLNDVVTQKGQARLVIEGLDQLEKVEQEKFVTLLKDKRAGTYQLPTSVQIVMPVTDKAKIADKIQAISLSWTVS